MIDISFSIIIPLYNKAGYIEKTLQSVLSQSYSFFEVLLIDDGSTDASKEKIEPYLADKRFNYHFQENAGVSAARNNGISKAQMPFIAFLDADDLWHKDFLNEIVNLIAMHPECDIFSTGWNYYINAKRYSNNSGVKNISVIDDYCKHSIHYSIICSSCVVVRKKVFKAKNLFPVGMSSGEDLYTWVKIADRRNICYSDKKYAEYTYTNARVQRLKKTDLIIYRFSDLLDSNCSKYKQNYLCKLAYNRAIIYLKSGKRRLAKEEISAFSYADRTLRRRYLLYYYTPYSLLFLLMNVWFYFRKHVLDIR